MLSLARASRLAARHTLATPSHLAALTNSRAFAKDVK